MGKTLEQVRAAVSELLGAAPGSVPVASPLRDLGVDSVGLTKLAVELERRLERPVPAWAVWRYPTVTALAAFLDGETGAIPVPESRRNTRRDTEPIAIVGLGCRLPGGIGSPGELWRALLSEVDAVGEVPADRWDAGEWQDADVAAPGKTTTRRGGFLDDVAGFDAAFFRISPAEAERTDPQQRIALEVAWSALEDARIVPGGLTGSRTGVFLGTMWQEYHLATGADPAAIGAQSAAGWDTSIIPARIAYALGLQGPAVSVGTACSSSLGAVHLAAHSLRRGESELAVAGGISLMLHPHTTVGMTKFGGINPDGECRAFDADAAGYVRSEGCGIVVLRRLSDALREGDRIYAVLRGSATNNDGASNGLTAPNPEAQADVLRLAWAEAGVPAAQVSYVEAHGTGTPLGDVIEAAALGEVFGPGRVEPLRIGSAKTNFGHLEPAAGALGLIKTALALHHGELPASLHFDTPNPKIDFAAQRLEVVGARSAWPDGPRFAGVSGFGFGGTNVHLALAESPYRRRKLIALAGNSESVLRELLADATDPVHVKGSGPYRGFAAVNPGEQPELTFAEVPSPARPLAFCFSGHGGQWVGMGRDLLAEPVFRQTLSDVDTELRAVTGWSVLDELTGETRLDRTDVIQPSIFAVQVALARTLASWGVVPDVVFGQSIGEVAAAVVSGALTLAEGARVIGTWSRLIARRASGTGTVIIAELDRAGAERLSGGRLSFAGQLSPDQVCLSGRTEFVDEVERELGEAGVRTWRVDIDYPSHSAELDALVPELVVSLEDLRPAEAVIPFLSTVTGGPLLGKELDAEYWARNMCEPMLLTDAVQALPEGARIVEVGPHPVLRPSLERTLPGSAVLITGRRDRPARLCLEDLAGLLWTDGVEVNWEALGAPARSEQPLPWTLSARTAPALRDQAEALRAQLLATPGFDVADIGFSLATTRTSFEHRAVVLATEQDEFLDGLAALAAGEESPALTTGTALPADGGDPGPVLVFSGQGSQWAGMALELLNSSPVFAEAFDECAQALEKHVDWSPVRALGDAAELAKMDVVQPLLWAVMVSMARLWEAHGVRPAAVVGHSQGEIAAACAAGALSIEDGALVVARRGKVIARELAGKGGLVSVALSVDDALRYAERWNGKVTLGAENGPGSAVLAGPVDTLGDLLESLRADGIRCRQVPIDYASHSAQVEPVEPLLAEVLAPIRALPSEVTFLSTVTGEATDTTELGAGYWYRNLRAPVRFRQAIERLTEAGHRTFIEVSPHPVLTMAIQETRPEVVVVGSIRRDDGGIGRFLASVAEAQVRGVPVSWPFSGARAVDLPTYRFQRQRYWLETGRTAPALARPADAEFWAVVGEGDPAALRSILDIHEDASLPELMTALATWRERETARQPEPVPEAAATPSETGLRDRIAQLPPDSRRDAVLEVVFRHTAAVLKLDPGDRPAVDTAFRELGFDSVSGVDLANRLRAETGLALPATLVFENPTPAALTTLLLTEFDRASAPAAGTGLATLEAMLRTIEQTPDALSTAELDRLRLTVRELDQVLNAAPEAEPEEAAPELDAISDDELFRFIDAKLGQA